MERFAAIHALIVVTVAVAGLYILTVGAISDRPLLFVGGIVLYSIAWLYGLVRANAEPGAAAALSST
jgi:small neutral amino acid transporter SnatA (MarC family)